jgi:hypothetical protein
MGFFASYGVGIATWSRLVRNGRQRRRCERIGALATQTLPQSINVAQART